MKLRKDFWKRIIVSSLGLVICGLGLGYYSQTNLGVTDINVFATGLGNVFHITLGQATTIYSVILLTASFFIDKSKIGIMTAAAVFLFQYPIDFASSLYHRPESFILVIIIGLISMAVMFFGASMMIAANVGVTIYDCFTLGITDRFKLNYQYVRWACDGFFVVVGYLLGGQLGIGTIFAFVVVGKVITFFKNLVTKVCKFDN